MHHRIRLRTPHIWTMCLTLGIGLLVFVLALSASPAQAAPTHHPVTQDDKPGSDYCLACHQEEGLDKTLGTESLAVTINPTQFGLTVHAEEGLACVDCHTQISEYPHPDVKTKSIRQYQLSYAESCQECHEDQYTASHDSVHQIAMDEGNENAPLCADCHNPHTQTRIIGETSGELTIAARKEVPSTCSTCHTDAYEIYKNSVHGSALTDGNTDVPTCTDCHGVHNIGDPTTDSFRNNTPALCADCHDNEELMNKYGLSTQILETYVADFHGTTATLFEQQFPGQPINTAVCSDCHGIHDIASTKDSETGIAMQENLLVKCQRCHPDATANFSAAWMGHYPPSPDHYPIVYYVDLFYKFFIPAVLGGMLFFILTDIYRRIVNRVKGARH
ncbi:MAG: cytochrome c3 family protein [Anaerolineales bacterium]|nr:cytochrome c3 family protein [Anaerolineales bacterium]